MMATALMTGLNATSYADSYAQNHANVTFELKDKSLATQICVIAAEQGLRAARLFAKTENADYNTLALTVKCNGYSLAKFSRRYAELRASKDAVSNEYPLAPVALVAERSNPASKLCIDAVIFGETVAREKHGINDDHITCNERPLKKFVASFAKRDIIVSESN